MMGGEFTTPSGEHVGGTPAPCTEASCPRLGAAGRRPAHGGGRSGHILLPRGSSLARGGGAEASTARRLCPQPPVVDRCGCATAAGGVGPRHHVRPSPLQRGGEPVLNAMDAMRGTGSHQIRESGLSEGDARHNRHRNQFSWKRSAHDPQPRADTRNKVSAHGKLWANQQRRHVTATGAVGDCQLGCVPVPRGRNAVGGGESRRPRRAARPYRWGPRSWPRLGGAVGVNDLPAAVWRATTSCQPRRPIGASKQQSCLTIRAADPRSRPAAYGATGDASVRTDEALPLPLASALKPRRILRGGQSGADASQTSAPGHDVVARRRCRIRSPSPCLCSEPRASWRLPLRGSRVCGRERCAPPCPCRQCEPGLLDP